VMGGARALKQSSRAAMGGSDLPQRIATAGRKRISKEMRHRAERSSREDRGAAGAAFVRRSRARGSLRGFSAEGSPPHSGK
jgi:hypothetical protein